MIRQKIEKLIRGALNNLGIEEVSFVVEHPAEFDKGDYATNIALVLSKKLGKNPKQIAEELSVEIQKFVDTDEDLQKIEVAGPGFINFYLTKDFFKKSISEILDKGNEYGKNGKLFTNQIWAVEYASPNPNKAMHLGHMRNTVTGVTICNLLESNGAKVIREMVDNDRGIAIAKLMWGYLVGGKKFKEDFKDISYWHEHKNEWLTPTDTGEKPDRFADRMYVIGAEEFNNEDNEKSIRRMVVDWEAKDPIVWDLWSTVLSWVHDGQGQTLKRLGASFDYVWHEHEHYEDGKKYVEKGLKEGIFQKLEDGAIVTNLGSKGLTDTIVQKNDGTALYITQDIALTELKKKKHNADKMVWVIGPEQSLAMQQLFAVCEQLGIAEAGWLNFKHISYGYVSIKGQGKMSSRAGNVVYADDFLDEVKNKVKDIIKDRVESDQIEIISENIAKGVVTYEMLKMGRTKDTAFDFDNALSFEGDSGPYLQYAVTRAHSVLHKADVENITLAVTADDFEITNLEKMLYRFPEVVERAGEDFAPQLVTTYITELAGVFNSWYGNHVIVSGEDNSPYRVALTKAFTHVMQNGLSILAIPVPSKM